MTKQENLLDTLVHKELVLKVGTPLIKDLYEKGEKDIAEQLTIRLILHDNSKVEKEEIAAFTSIQSNKGMKDPNVEIDEETKKQLKLHWKNNRHHPEHFSDYNNMSEVDVLEMVIDWYARSVQNKTNFLRFVAIRQKNRFKFEKNFYDKVYEYCEYIKKLNEEEIKC